MKKCLETNTDISSFIADNINTTGAQITESDNIVIEHNCNRLTAKF